MDLPLNILLVDDEVAVHEIYEFFFEEEVKSGKMTLVCFDRGQKILDHIAKTHSEKPIFAVLSDINMPGIDGFEVLREIKDKYPEIKVIMETAYDGDTFTQRARDLGADGYFNKPIDFDAIKNYLHELLEKSSI